MAEIKETIVYNLENWVNDFSDELFRWSFFKTANKEVSEDLVQDTFLAAASGIKNYQGKSSPKTWLFSILKNKIADYHKEQIKKKNKGLSDHDLSGFFDKNGKWLESSKPIQWNEEPTHLLDDIDFKLILQNCMKALPDLWHSAITLKYLTSKKGQEICQELDISETNYWQILHRAKLQLRSCIDTNWFKK